MGELLLQIWILACTSYYALSSIVTRDADKDTIFLTKCVKSCEKYNAHCPNYGTCCNRCNCIGLEKAFYKKNSTQACVRPDNADGCKYHLERRKDWIAIRPRSSETELGMLYHREVKLYSYKCSIVKQRYWDLRTWKYFGRNRKPFEIYKKTDYFIKLDIPGKDRSQYEGQLVKLDINCIKNKDKEKSCMILRILGKRNYNATFDTVIIVPTKKPTTTVVKATSSGKPKKKKNYLIILIIAVTAVVLLVIGALLICWCRKKKRKSGGSKGEKELLNGEDPNYQNTDRFSVRHSNEIHNNACNLTYLQPVDAGLPSKNSTRAGRSTVNNDKKKKKKDHNYDYPDVHNLSRKSDHSVAVRPSDDQEKPIYAEVGDLRSPDPEYTSPDSIIKPRSDTEVVGVPGYQPPRGPTPGDTGSVYSALGVISSDDNSVYQVLLDPQASQKSNAPKYHVVEPEPVSPDDEGPSEIII